MSTYGGLSIGIDDMLIPETKWDVINRAEKEVTEINRQYTEGLITQGEKYNKVVDIWAKATDEIADEMMDAMQKPYAGRPAENPDREVDKRLQDRMSQDGNDVV